MKKQSQPGRPKSSQNAQPLYSSTREAAAMLDVCRNTIRNWIRLRHLPAVRFGKTYRIPREAIEGLIK